MYIHLSQTCDIQMEGAKRRLILKTVQIDQSGEVSYTALNAITSAMLTVTGKPCSWKAVTLSAVIFPNKIDMRSIDRS